MSELDNSYASNNLSSRTCDKCSLIQDELIHAIKSFIN